MDLNKGQVIKIMKQIKTLQESSNAEKQVPEDTNSSTQDSSAATETSQGQTLTSAFSGMSVQDSETSTEFQEVKEFLDSINQG